MPLTLLDEYGQQAEVEALVDTGFTGYLALSSNNVVQQLQLPQADEEEVDLADGSTTVLALYKVTVMWHDEPQTLTAYAVAGRSLVGMKLLRGSLVTLEMTDDGKVFIEPGD